MFKVSANFGCVLNIGGKAVPTSLIQPWMGSAMTPCFNSQDPHAADDGDAKLLRNVSSYKSHTALTSQKTAFFRVTAVKTSNLT
jgi:hypothetical protein